MAWRDTIGGEILHGDRPQGDYWERIPDRPNGEPWIWDNVARLWKIDPVAQAAAERAATDEAERQATKVDPQILADLNLTPAEVNNTVDTVFAGFTAGQRTFLKRLVRIVIACGRRVLRNGA